MSATFETIADPRPEPKRDRYGRYLIPDPETGKERPWTRATTWAKTCSDTFGLTKWELRMTALGLAKRPDLLAQVATVTDPDDRDAKKLLDGVCEDAKEAAGSSIRRNLGTALHAMTEHIDAGRDFTVPDAHRADLDAYRAATSGLKIDPSHIERIVTVPTLGVAGTFDRLVTHDGQLMVADLKTGWDVLYGMGEIAIQLALYANAATIYDAATATHTPMPDVSRERALVFHLPVGEATCTIYEVDVAAGWEMAQVCGTVRTWRKRKDLARMIEGRKETTTYFEDPNTGDGDVITEVEVVSITPDRTEWIVSRVQAIKADLPERVDALRERWDLTGIAKQPPWTDDEIDQLSTIIHHVEDSWPQVDPATPELPDAAFDPPAPAEHPALWPAPEDGPNVDDSDAAAIRTAIGALEGDDLNTIRAWTRDANKQDRPWSDGSNIHARGFAIARSALRCIRAFPYGGRDNKTRAAIAYVIGDDLQPAWRTGAVLGSLTADQADQLADLADAYKAKDKTARTVIDVSAA